MATHHTVRLFLLALAALFVCHAHAHVSLTPYSFGGAVFSSVMNDNSPAVVSNTSFIVRKDGSVRVSGVIDFIIPELGENEYYHIAKVQIPVKSTIFAPGASARINIRPVEKIDVAGATYNSLVRISDPIDQSGVVDKYMVVSLDVALVLENNIRTFEVSLIGSGASLEVELGIPTLVLEYPAWSFEPVDTGCVTAEHPLDDMTGPGIVSSECDGYVSNDLTFLYIHGMPTYDDMWDDMPLYMQQYGKVIMVNLPGNGRSGDIIFDEQDPAIQWPALVVDKLVDWIRQRNLTNLIIAGQDMGGPTGADLTDRLVPEGRIAGLDWAEAVSADQILCPSNDGSDGCYADGSVIAINPNGSPNEFMVQCFGLNIAGIAGTPTEGLNCADYMLGQNWSDNYNLLFDPIVRVFAAQINPENATATYIAYPPFIAPCINNVYNLLSPNCKTDEFLAAKYCGGVPCEQAVATQGQRHWPRVLYTHGYPTGQHNIWLKEFNLRMRASLESGNLSTIPVTIHCVDDIGFATIADCKESHVAWAENHYPSLRVNRFGGRMGHFFTEDGFNGAYSFARSQADVHALSA